VTLVKANARSALITLVASSIAAPAAAGNAWAAGPAWVLRAGTIVYLIAVPLALRLPSQVDVPVLSPDETPTEVIDLPRGPDGTLALGPGARPRRKLRALTTLGSVGPVVAEAMRGNAVLRALSGYMIFFLAFLLRSAHFGVSHNVALGGMVAAAAAGGLAAMGIGSMVGSRAPQVLMYTMLLVATVVTAVSAWFFGFGTALIVAFVAALSTGLAKLAQDAIVQNEIREDVRSSAFSVSETLHQLSWVAGGLAGLLVSMLNNGQVGLAIVAGLLAVATAYLVSQRRKRIRLAPQQPPASRPANYPAA